MERLILPLGLEVVRSVATKLTSIWLVRIASRNSKRRTIYYALNR